MILQLAAAIFIALYIFPTVLALGGTFLAGLIVWLYENWAIWWAVIALVLIIVVYA